MKRILSIALIFILCFTLFACGDENNTDTTTTTTSQNTTTTTTTKDNTTTTENNTTTTENNTTTTENNTTTTEGGTTTTTTTKKNTTTTTKKNPTTTTTNKSTTTDKYASARTDGVINKSVTKTVSMYKANMNTFEAGAKQNRTIVFKGTIKIGNTAATSGAFASVGVPFNQGLKAYINTINFNGGIGGDYASGKQGYYIEFLHYDDNFVGDYGLTYTKKLVEEDKIFALVGQFGSPTVGATIDYIKNKGVIACYFASGISALFNADADTVKTGSTLFPVQPIYSTEGGIIVGRIIEQYPNAKKIGVIYTTSDEVGLGIKDGAVAQIKSLGSGYQCVTSQATANAADFTSVVTKVADCDAVIVASVQNTAVNIIKAMIANGVYKPVFVSYSLASSQFLTDIKPYYDTLDSADKFPIYANAWLSATDINSYLDFAEDIIGYEGSANSAVNSYAMAGWIAANAFCEGLDRVVKSGKEINNLTYVEAMESGKIKIGMASGATLNYSNGYRFGTTTMSLLKSNATCNSFEEFAGMKDFYNFIKSAY